MPVPGHFTADAWDEYIRTHFGTIPEAEAFRNDNNVFVDGLPPPRYTGPLSSGGSAGVKPQTQGTSSVDPEDQTDDQPEDMPQGALPGPMPYGNVNEWARDMRGLTGEETAWGKKIASEREKALNAAREALQQRRFGPSRTEQLFALASAIGKPMIRPSFGGVMNNVTSTLADIEKANREAQMSRADALAALEQTGLNQRDAAKLAEFNARYKAIAPMGAVLARMAGGSQYNYAPDRGGYVPKPGTGNSPPMPEMDQYGNYVITDQRQVVYLPPNSPIVLPGGDPSKPKYTRAGTTR